MESLKSLHSALDRSSDSALDHRSGSVSSKSASKLTSTSLTSSINPTIARQKKETEGLIKVKEEGSLKEEVHSSIGGSIQQSNSTRSLLSQSQPSSLITAASDIDIDSRTWAALKQRIPDNLLRLLLIENQIKSTKQSLADLNQRKSSVSGEILREFKQKRQNTLLIDLINLSEEERKILGQPGYLEVSFRSRLKSEAPSKLSLKQFKECVARGLQKQLNFQDPGKAKKMIDNWEQEYLEEKYGTGEYYLYVPHINYRSVQVQQSRRTGGGSKRKKIEEEDEESDDNSRKKETEESDDNSRKKEEDEKTKEKEESDDNSRKMQQKEENCFVEETSLGSKNKRLKMTHSEHDSSTPSSQQSISSLSNPSKPSKAKPKENDQYTFIHPSGN